jgi:hypothetical protein
MEKWADYLIAAIRYEDNPNNGVISHLKVHIDNGDSIGASSTWTKQEVLNAISNGNTFSTIHKIEEGKWKKGRGVFLSTSDKEFLGTESGSLTKDELSDIPDF